jgi:hypothetical protein
MASHWVPDENAHNCFQCNTSFGLMTRRHHCRNCGGVFCNSCSDRRIVLKNSDGPVRVCRKCYTQLTTKQKAASIVTLGKSTIRLLYETRSVCIHCSVTEQNGFKFGHVLAYVLQYEEKIYLYTLCSNHIHVPNITLLCSNATFYHYLMTFKQSFEYGYSIIDQFLSIPPLTPQQQAIIRPFQSLYPQLQCLSTTSSLLDKQSSQQTRPQDPAEDPYTALSSLHSLPVQVIDDFDPKQPNQQQPNQQQQSQNKPPQQVYGLDSKELYKRILLPQKTPHLLPLIVEVELAYGDGLLRSDNDLITELGSILAFYPPGYGFLLKLNVGLAGSYTDDGYGILMEVNNKIMQLHEWLERYFLEQELFTTAGSPNGLNGQFGDDSDASIGNNQQQSQQPQPSSQQPQSQSQGLAGQMTGLSLNTNTQLNSASSSTNPSSSTSALVHQNKITILVDSSFDRLILLCEVPNTIFLKSNVFPFLRYYLQLGEEQTCVAELKESFSKLSTFSHMNICVMMILESEGGLTLPNLTPVMQLLLQNTYLIRMILFYQQRNVPSIVSRAADRYELITSLYQTATIDVNNHELIQQRLQQIYGPNWDRQTQDHQHQAQNIFQQYQQQLIQERSSALTALKELGIDEQMINMVSKFESSHNHLVDAHRKEQQNQSGLVQTMTTVTTPSGQTIQVPVQSINTNLGPGLAMGANPGVTNDVQNATNSNIQLPKPQQIRFAPGLLSQLTYKWLQSPLYYYQRQQTQGAPTQGGQKAQNSVLKDTHMETVDILPLLNAINVATGNSAPIQTWFPISALQPLAPLVSKKLRTHLLLNFNSDPLGCISTIVIHKQGYGIPTDNANTTANNNPSANTSITSLAKNGFLDLLNIGMIFDLKKLMNQIEQLTRTSGINTDPNAPSPRPEPTSPGKDGSSSIQKQQQTWRELLNNAIKLNQIISSSTLPSAPVGVTSLFSITGETKQQQRRKIKSTQMICIMNATDIGSIDALRRCRTIGITRNNQGGGQMGNNGLFGAMGGGGNGNGSMGSSLGGQAQFVASDHQCL